MEGGGPRCCLLSDLSSKSVLMSPEAKIRRNRNTPNDALWYINFMNGERTSLPTINKNIVLSQALNL